MNRLYDQIARYYDLIHAGLTADIGFTLALAAEYGGAVLELGCGSGRLLLPLAAAGHSVVGLDSSPTMLALARHKLASSNGALRQRIELHEGDMAAFELRQRGFGLAIIPYNTLLHVLPERLTTVFRAIGKHAREDGRLFIDLPNPNAIASMPDERVLTLERSFIDPATGEQVLQLAASWVEPADQRLHTTWIFDATPLAGGSVQRTIAEAIYQYYYPHQLELHLGQSGWQLEAIYGSYEREPFDEASDRLLLLARRSR